jgi:hypothetical protein
VGGLKGYFFHTYAFVEYLRGNTLYKEKVEGGGITSILNLMELYHRTLAEHGEDVADKVYLTFRAFAVGFGDDDVRNAMKLRLKLRGKGVATSYADAVGYYLSLKHNVRFLTGDKAFRDLENVEFLQ